MLFVDIHQIQVKFDTREDRLLMQVRTRAGEMVAVWLTRRMMQRLWPALQEIVTPPQTLRLTGDSLDRQHALAMPAEAAGRRPPPGADFTAPFDDSPASHPLGIPPLLPDAIDITAVPGQRRVHLRVREPAARQLEMNLGDELATALLRLLDKAMTSAGWLPEPHPPAPTAAPAEPVAPTVLH